jgi:tail protein
VTLADLTWQYNGGVILNDDSVAPFVDVNIVSGFDNVPYRETFRDHEGNDGGFMDAEFEVGRDIILDVTVYAFDVNNIESYLDSLKANYAPRTTPAALIYKDAGVAERVVFCKPRGIRFRREQEYRTGVVTGQVAFYAEDPRIYDNVLQGVTIPFGGPATTGFGFNFGFNLDFGATVPVIGGDVIVGGNRPTPAIMTITGPVTNPRIINVTDSKSLDFLIDLSVTDTLVVDLDNRTVTLNGNSNRRNALRSPDWWLFNPGTTFIVFGGGVGSGQVLIQYRNAWR